MSTFEDSLRMAANSFVDSVLGAVRIQLKEREEASNRLLSTLSSAVELIQTRHLQSEFPPSSVHEHDESSISSRNKNPRTAPAPAPKKTRKARVAKAPDLPSIVADVVSDYGSGMAISEVVAMTGMPVHHVRSAIKTAMDSGWIRMEGERRFSRYFPVSDSVRRPSVLSEETEAMHEDDVEVESLDHDSDSDHSGDVGAA